MTTPAVPVFRCQDMAALRRFISKHELIVVAACYSPWENLFPDFLARAIQDAHGDLVDLVVAGISDLKELTGNTELGYGDVLVLGKGQLVGVVSDERIGDQYDMLMALLELSSPNNSYTEKKRQRKAIAVLLMLQQARANSRESRRSATAEAPARTSRSPFEVLGVAPTASKAEAEAAWRNLLKQYHPDKVAERLKQLADELSKEINGAWATLKREKGW